MFSILLLSSVLWMGTQGQFQLFFGSPTPAVPNVGGGANADCVDKMQNCNAFEKKYCHDPYTAWARENCGNFCGFCVGVPTQPPPCVDSLNNCKSYGANVCTDPKYTGWVGSNCRYFCRMCTAAQLAAADRMTTTIAPADCLDKLDCKLYGKTSCTGKFKTWAEDNCKSYCGFCHGLPTPPQPCVDKIPNCNVYESSTCSNPDYKAWASENCMKFCGMCSGSSGMAIPPNPGKRGIPAKRQLDGTGSSAGSNGFNVPLPQPTPKPTTTPEPTTTQTTTTTTTTTPAPTTTTTTPAPTTTTTTPEPTTTTPQPTTTKAPAPRKCFPEAGTGSSAGGYGEMHPAGSPGGTASHAEGNNCQEEKTTVQTPTPGNHVGTQGPDLTPMPSSKATTSGVNVTPDITPRPPSTTAPPMPDSTPQAPDTTPQAPDTTPQAPDTTPMAPDTTPMAPDTTPQAPDTTPQAPDTTPMVPDTTTQTPSTTPQAPKSPTPLPTTMPVSTTRASPSTSGNTPANTPANTPGLLPNLTNTDNGNFTGHNNDTCDNLLGDDCRLYEKSKICVNGSIYRPWAEIRCRAYCGFCIVPTSPGPCVDKINNCIEYNDDLCTNPLFRLFREDNCQKFCGLCSTTAAVTTPMAPKTPQPITTQAPAVTTQAPVVTTQAPAVTTQAPVVTTQAPAVTTQAPAVTTQAPVVTTQAPAVTTQAPVVTTQAPVVTTQAPAVTTQQPVDTTQPPTFKTPPPLTPKPIVQDTTTEAATSALPNTPPPKTPPPNTPPPLSTDMPTPAPLGNLNTSEDCANKDTDCDYYNDDSCVGIYELWARDHCALRCGYCENKTEPCINLINYCDKFEPNMCTEYQYSGYARTNCRAFCSLCGVPVHNANATSTNDTATPAPIRATTQKTQQVTSGNGTNIATSSKNTFVLNGPPSNRQGFCLYKNNYVQENDMYKDGCDYNCVCLDASVNEIECTDLCPHWQNYSSDCKLTGKPGQCCQDLVCGGQALIPTTPTPTIM